jgi:hypothetical protein
MHRGRSTQHRETVLEKMAHVYQQSKTRVELIRKEERQIEAARQRAQKVRLSMRAPLTSGSSHHGLMELCVSHERKHWCSSSFARPKHVLPFYTKPPNGWTRSENTRLVVSTNHHGRCAPSHSPFVGIHANTLYIRPTRPGSPN